MYVKDHTIYQIKSCLLINSQCNIGTMPRVNEFTEFEGRRWKEVKSVSGARGLI